MDASRTLRSHRVLAVMAAGVLVGAVNGVLAPVPAAAVGTAVATFQYDPNSPGAQTWTVPPGVFSATFVLTGGAGGPSRGGDIATAGGRGGRLTATLPVTPGTSYTIMVGSRGASYAAGGAGGFNGGRAGGAGWSPDGGGGGGGGASDVRFGGTDLAHRILVAGGGGGDSGPDHVSVSGSGQRGGSGGGGSLGTFGDPGTFGGNDTGGAGGGRGGTASAGGAGGRDNVFDGNVFTDNPDYAGADGSEGLGGTGGHGAPGGAGGGGGGGWFGGGGGAGSVENNGAGGGGGGGSGYADPAASVLTSSRVTVSTDGIVSIQYADADPSATLPTVTGTPDDAVVGKAFSFPFTTTGNPPPTCSVTAGTAPPGLGVSSACVLSGTPTTVGTYTFTVTASNGTNPATVAVTMDVLEAPTISGTPPSPAPGHSLYSFPYTFDYTLTGSPTPTTAVTSGAPPTGLTLDSAGHLSGVPRAAGTYTFEVTASNGADPPARITSTVEIQQAVQGSVSGHPPSTAYQGVPFDFTYTLGGYPLPPATLLLRNTLPPGLTLGEDGHITGSPTAIGTWDFTVLADNGFDGVAAIPGEITVLSPGAAIAGSPPTPVTVGDTVDFSFGVSGSPTPTTAVASGHLPPGVDLDAAGHLTGTYTTEGTYTFAVTATNAGGASAPLQATIVVNPQGQPATITGTPPTPAGLGVPYYFSYTLGGTPAPTTTVSSGDLPTGLALGLDGHLTGTPTALGSYTFTVAATNGVGAAAGVSSTVVVEGLAATIGGTPPSGGVGEPYSFTFTTGGNPPPTVTRSAGALPPGLTLSSTGKLSGTPTRTGTYSVTVQAANGVGTAATRSVTLKILALPTLSISGSVVQEGNSGTRPLTLTVRLSRASTLPVTVHWGTVNGTAVAGSDFIAGSGTLTFSPGQTLKTMTVWVKGDRTRERNEGFLVRLSSPGHATVSHPDGIAGILNDD